MKSLKTLILTSIITLTVLGSVVFFFVSANLSNSSLDQVYTTDIEDMIKLVAQFIEKENTAKFELINTIAHLPFMTDPDLSNEEKQLQLDLIGANNSDIIDITIADTKGVIKKTGKRASSISSRQDFIDANNGRLGINGPVVDIDSNQLVIYYSVPVIVKDKTDKSVLSIAINGESLSEICKEFLIGGYAHPFILDKYTTLFLGSEKESLVQNKHTYMEDAKKENYGDLTSALFEFASTKSDIFYFTIDGKWIYLPYSQINNTNWCVCAEIPEYYLKNNTKQLRIDLLLIAAGLLGCGFLISLFVARATNPLQTLGDAITRIGSGSADLSTRLEIKHVKQEIADVVSGFNSFVSKLHDIIATVHKSEEKLNEVNWSLQESAQDTATSITQIIANIESVNTQIKNESLSVNETAFAINEITANIESLERMINNQAQGVETASVAIKEMIENIDTVNSSITTMVNYFKSLEQNASLGIRSQNDVNERLQKVDEQSKMLQEANTVISSIAEQTNLLAMNAAIEAAHAGDAGKGFSVVADEIRKLSETSSMQSEAIGQELADIQQSIAVVVSASAKASEVFTSLSTDFSKTDGVVHQIIAAMEKQQEGTKQITEALSTVDSTTFDVKEAASSMAEQSNNIRESVKTLQNVAAVMNDSIAEMSIGAQEINNSGTKLSLITDEVSESINTIHIEIAQFKL